MTTKLERIRCLCLDVDGVMTDGRLIVDNDGHAARAFHAQDGLALHWWQRLGGTVIICTGKESACVAARARELGIEHVIQGSQDKLADLQAKLTELDIELDEVAMVGDDLPDLPVLRKCGYPIAVANAVAEVRAVARLVTTRPGGAGAVRDAIEGLLRPTGRWAEVVAHYERGGADIQSKG